MSNNKFFFRGDEGDYSTSEMRKRIPSFKISPETPEVIKMLEELNEVPSQSSSLSKNSHLDLVQEECSYERYEEYISELFEEYGIRGDRFNLQLYELKGGEISYQELVDKAEELLGTDVSDEFSDIRDIPLALREVNPDKERRVVDFSFQTIESEEWLNPTEDLPIVVYQGGKKVQEYRGEDYEIKAPATYRIEARVYADSDLVAVSNFSSISDGDQSDIVEIIGSIGRTENKNDR